MEPVEIKVRPRYWDHTTVTQHAVPGAINTIPAENDLYNKEEIFKFIRRSADKAWVVNDGNDSLFVRYATEGVESFSDENVVFPKEYKVYYNVFELRLRSPTQDLPYRVSEFEIQPCCTGGDGGGDVVVTNTPLPTDPIDDCTRLLGELCYAGSPVDPRAIRALTFLIDSVDVSGSTVSLAGTVDVSDRCARLLGQLCVGGVAIDPRIIRALTNADVVTADGSNAVALQQLAVTNDLITRPFGSQGQQLQQKAATFELLTDPVDRATRLLGVTYGSQGQQLQQLAGTFDLITRPFGSQAQQLLQRAVTFDLEVQLRAAGVEYDARQIRNLVFATDKVDVTGSSVTVSGAVTATVTALTPIQKALQHNVALPAAGADLLGANLSPTNTPCSFRISIAVSITGQLTLVRINGGVEVKPLLNGGVGLNESVEYTFDVQVYAGDTINLEYSTTGGTVMILRIAEIDAAVTSG